MSEVEPVAYRLCRLSCFGGTTTYHELKTVCKEEVWAEYYWHVCTDENHDRFHNSQSLGPYSNRGAVEYQQLELPPISRR